MVSFGDDLSWGPIASMDERVAWLDTECPIPGSWDWLPEEDETFWKEAGQPAAERLIWLSGNSADEVAGYLAYLERYSDLPAAVVRTNEHIPPHPTFGPLIGSGSANAEQLADVLSHAERRPIAADHALAGRWAELRAENALLRIMDGEQLVSAPVETYDRLLHAAVTGDWQKGMRVIGGAIGASFDEQVRINSEFLFYRLGALVKSGELEAQGDVLGWDDEQRRIPAMVRKPG